MTAKSWRLLLGILGVLALYVVIVERPWQDDIRGPAPRRDAWLFPDVDPASVSAITIRTATQATRFEKEAGKWLVASEGRFPADEKGVTELIARIDTVRTGAVVSENPARQSALGVDSSGVEVTFQAGQKTVAHFRVGNSTPDFAGLFLRPEGGHRVFGVAGLNRYQFDRGQQSWRDRRILSFDPEAVRMLTMARADSVVTLTRQGADSLLNAAWNLTGNQPGEGVADARKDQVRGLVRQLSNLTADGFPPAGDSGPPEWGRPVARVDVDLNDNRRLTLEFGPIGPNGQHYVRVPGVTYGGTEALYLLGPWRLKALARTYTELAPAPAAPPPGG